MIVVIADDFTGAAEIGGLAFSFGYKAAVLTKLDHIPDVEILIVATDMRSLNAKSAAGKSQEVTAKLIKLKPEMIYKKIDSVLRGNVVVELQSQMKISKKSRALIIPANPLLERRIRNGVYYIGDQPLMDSFFAQDKSFKNRSSNVVEILDKKAVHNICNKFYDDILPNSGLIIGNTENQDDLMEWVKKIDVNTAVVGASGFFEEILRSKGSKKGNFNPNIKCNEIKSIFISGSNFPLSKKSVVVAKNNGASVSLMPDDIYFSLDDNSRFVDAWVEEIISMFDSSNKVVVAVLQNPSTNSISSLAIKELLGVLIKRVMNKIEIDEIFIEGGSTAQFIAKALSFSTFYPIQALSPGVTRMKIGEKEGVQLTLKPGSYGWPKTIWNFD